MSPFILAIIISFALAIGLGFVWYSPALFGKSWKRLHGIRPDAVPAARAMALVVLANALVTLLYVAALLFALVILLPVNAFSILVCVLALYAGFVLPVIAQQWLWTPLPRRSAWQAFGITAGYQLLIAIVVGIVFFWIMR